MTSQINPNNINGAYPVAGQDNNSQGFRDNFTNTSNNFQYAYNEITDLQNKVVLKQALTGTTLNNNMLGSALSNAVLSEMSEAVVNLGSVGGSVTLNFALGSYQTLSTSGSVQLGFSNLPAAGAAGTIVVQINVTNVAYTVTFPTAVSINAQGIQGLDPSTNTVTFSAIGTYTFEFVTSNGGTAITVSEVNKPLQPFNNSSENLPDATGANLAVTTSYFSTVTTSNGTLAAGVSGQIKVFACASRSGGNKVITVTNPAWGGAGTITFTTTGQACTLQYIDNKWFCIGNNGATFA
jgi:hypothetical protein